MASTTPNKETVRRVSILNGAKYCYISVNTDDDFVYIFSDVETRNIIHFKNELESWCGMAFKVFDLTTKKEKIKSIKKNWELILPIKSID